MEQIKKLYDNSLLFSDKKVKGFLINVHCAEAFTLYCRVKGITMSDAIELYMRKEVENYLKNLK